MTRKEKRQSNAGVDTSLKKRNRREAEDDSSSNKLAPSPNSLFSVPAALKVSAVQSGTTNKSLQTIHQYVTFKYFILISLLKLYFIVHTNYEHIFVLLLKEWYP
jgi:hypothetical protein